LKLSQSPNRVGIFAYYDADGIVDDYIPVLVGAVRPFCSYLLCVVNGELNEEGRQKLQAVSDEILLRPNEGLDITGYKEGLFHLREKILQAEEVLFFNQTIFGPLTPLDEMFCEMNDRDLDFWGLTKYKGLKADLTDTIWNKVEYGYLPPHIQSFFFAVRGELLHAPVFWDYWETLPVIHDYLEAVSYHEVKFTKYFEDQGYHGEPYIDCTDWEQYTDYALMGMPAQIVQDKKCPFIKRKNFFTARTISLSVPQGGASWQLYQQLAQNGTYPIELVLQNITRTVPASEYLPALAPSFCPGAQQAPQAGTVVLVVRIDDAEFLPGLTAAAATVQTGGMVLCLAGSAMLQQLVQQQLPQAQVLLCTEDGFSILFAQLWQQVQGYEYLFYLSLIKKAIKDGLYRHGMIDTTVTALGNVTHNITMLNEQPGIGILLPLQNAVDERFSGFLPYDEAKPYLQLAPQLDELTFGKPLLWLCSGSFFARTSVMTPLATLPWAEINKLEHADWAQEIFLPLVAQQSGLLCGFALPWQDLMREYWNEKEYVERFVSIFETPNKKEADMVEFRMKEIRNFYLERRYQMTLQQAFAAKLGFKQKLWIILQLLLSPAAFERLQRLLHGGQLPTPPPPPEDGLD